MDFLKKTSAVLLLLLSSYYSIAQNCGCDKVITANSGYYVDGNSLSIKPGDTICLTGNRNTIAFRNIKGTPTLPVVIKNCGGKVKISTTASYGIKVDNCSNIKITGTGSVDEYGIEVEGTLQGVWFGNFSTDFEIDHVEVHDMSFAGIMAKTDPVCNDSTTWRQNFLMKNVNIHHNNIYNTAGEGIYLGYSFYSNGISCNGFTAYPHSIENAKVHHNKTFNTGCEGIQVGCAIKGCEIYNNRVEVFGQKPFSVGQENGMQIGEGTGGLCYNNFIKSGGVSRGGNGIIVLGIGDNLIYNNIIVNPGGYGIFLDERPPAVLTDSTSGFRVINNTILNSGTDGVKTYAELVHVNEIKNNIIVNPGNGKFINNQGGPGVPKMLLGNNVSTMDINTIKFINPDSSNYHIRANSPCVDHAENGAHWSIFIDNNNLSRPKGVAFDIGALEFDTSLVNNPPLVNAGKDTVVYYPQDSIIVTGVISDSDGSIDSYNWSVGPNDSLIILNKKSLTTKIKKLRKGTNTLRLNAVDNGNKSAFDELSILVLDVNKIPIVNAGNDTTLLYPINSLLVNGSSSDEDGSITSVSWTQVEGPTAIINNNTSLSTTITGLGLGKSIFRLTVIDNFGASSYDEIVINVNKSNSAPVVDAGKDTILVYPINSLQTYATASDDGSIVFYKWTQVEGSTAIINDSTILNTTITGLGLGKSVFRLMVTDNLGASSYDEIVINVNKPNSAPVVDAGKDTVLVCPINSLQTYAIASDDGSIVSYKWTQVEGLTTFINDSTVLNTTITGIGLGKSVFRLMVTDNFGTSSYDEIIIIVNKAPVVNAGRDTVLVYPVNSLQTNAIASDNDGSVVSSVWTQTEGSTAIINNSTALSTTITGLGLGKSVFNLVVTDNLGASSNDDVVIIVNKAPIVNAGSDINAVNTDSLFVLKGMASDDDGTISSIVWNKVSGPVAQIADSTSLVTNVTGFIGGVYQFKLKVKDDIGTESSDIVQVNVNSVPVVNLGNDRVITGVPNTSIASSVSDPDGQSLTLLWTKVSGPSVTLSSLTRTPLSLTNINYGVYVFRLTATDVLGAKGFDEITLVFNRAPTANAGPDLQIKLPQTTATINGSGSDIDGTISSYLWTQLSGPTVVMENNSVPVLKLNSLKKGTYKFRLQVKDNYSATAQDDVNVVVK